MLFQMVRWSFAALVVAALAIGIAATTMGGDLGRIALLLLVAAAFMLSACVSGPASSRLAAVEGAMAMAPFIYALHVISQIGQTGTDMALMSPLESTAG